MDRETFLKIQKAVMVADGFYDAAVFLKEQMRQDGLKLVVYGPPYTANLAFACEVYLKQLNEIEGRTIKGHTLSKLFNKLDEKTRTDIENEYKRRCEIDVNEHPGMPIELRLLSECIKEYDSAFEDWRYWYEGKKKSKSLGWRDFHIFIEVIRERVKTYIEVRLSGEE